VNTVRHALGGGCSVNVVGVFGQADLKVVLEHLKRCESSWMESLPASETKWLLLRRVKS
jgi:hypothetical protein